ncbi:cysteine-rich venom protein VAR4-like [Molossus nigricans]
MTLVGICFVVLLQQAAGVQSVTFLLINTTEQQDMFSLLTQQPSIQMEIINKHNDLRRLVSPSARNMLKMSNLVFSRARIKATVQFLLHVKAQSSQHLASLACVSSCSPECVGTRGHGTCGCEGHMAGKCKLKSKRSKSHPLYVYYKGVVVTGCGENLFMFSSPKLWSHAIQSLYDEVKDFKYGFGNTQANAVTGHYTQNLVSATSYQLGCAFAYCPHNILEYYYVCHYCPS